MKYRIIYNEYPPKSILYDIDKKYYRVQYKFDWIPLWFESLYLDYEEKIWNRFKSVEEAEKELKKAIDNNIVYNEKRKPVYLK